jgi:hypothetical protein
MAASAAMGMREIIITAHHEGGCAPSRATITPSSQHSQALLIAPFSSFSLFFACR